MDGQFDTSVILLSIKLRFASMAELHRKEPPAEWPLDGSVYFLALRLFTLRE